MVFDILTSKYNINLIEDFEYIYELARCSKCQMFIMLKSTNKLYGASDDSCCIHEIDIPFKINTDLVFRFDEIDKSIFSNQNNRGFFIPSKFDWVILPDMYWTDYVNGSISYRYSYEKDQNVLYSLNTGEDLIQFQCRKFRRYNDFVEMEFEKQLDGFFNRQRTLSYPIQFYGCESNPSIKKAYDNKTAMGRVLCELSYNSEKFAFYFFKGLFSLSKSDTLDIDIRPDVFQKNIFMATFKPHKKKNPMTINKYNSPFNEVIHCMFLNLA